MGLRPFHTNTDGVFLAGTCQSPKDVPDTVAHASAAAAETLSLLSRGEVVISPTTALVDDKLCSGCKTCLSLCPYTAITFNEDEQRWEPRPRWPKDSRCAAPQVKPRKRPASKLGVVVRFHEGSRHLPIVEVKPAA